MFYIKNYHVFSGFVSLFSFLFISFGFLILYNYPIIITR